MNPQLLDIRSENDLYNMFSIVVKEVFPCDKGLTISMAVADRCAAHAIDGASIDLSELLNPSLPGQVYSEVEIVYGD